MSGLQDTVQNQGKWRQEPGGEAEAEILEARSRYLSYTVQAHLPRNGAPYSGRCPPTSVSNQKRYAGTHGTTSSTEVVPQVRFLFPKCVKWTTKANCGHCPQPSHEDIKCSEDHIWRTDKMDGSVTSAEDWEERPQVS